MTGIRDALTRMLKTTLFLKKTAEACRALGLNDEVFNEAYGDMFDAIYYMVGEHTEEVENSVTWRAVNTTVLNDDWKVEMLMTAFEKNRKASGSEPKQPKPSFFTKAEQRRMFKENGGYMAPEGDWT